ncbi:MAG TPA: Mur ligase domain-containing protein, partial [Steroidobacteraceae bacterium]|nr:Mur ligase domain-containing protein [Steroidobacteraceae bacterium]
MSPSLPTASRSLAELTAGLLAAPPGIMVSDVTADSRAVTPGALFLACRGRTHHGLRFAAEAASRGARAVLYETDGIDP